MKGLNIPFQSWIYMKMRRRGERESEHVDLTSRLTFEECPDDINRLRGVFYCELYNTNKCKRREECLYYWKMQIISKSAKASGICGLRDDK